MKCPGRKLFVVLGVTATMTLTLAALAGCRARGGVNVVLISIDSLRADHLGAYGYSRPVSPNIDALAADGVVFENAISTTTWTLPSHMSMLTSLYPEVHGVNHDRKRLAERVTLVSEVFQSNGYSTSAIVSGPYLHRDYGYSQGFDLYDDRTIFFIKVPGGGNPSHLGVTSPKIHQRVIEILENVSSRPFFFFVHYWDVHYDYAPPPPYDKMFDPDYDGNVNADNWDRNEAIHLGMNPRDLEHVVALYDGEIAFTDEYVGKLFSALKSRNLWDDTLILLTSDHGDEFFEHGVKGHWNNLYGTTLNVPLILKFPRSRWKGRRVPALVSIVDIAPTMLEAAGLPDLPESNGRSLQSVMMEERTQDEILYFASLTNRFKAVLAGSMKLISTWDQRAEQGHELKLYDLSRDPGERADVANVEIERRERLWKILGDWVRVSAIRAEHLGESEFEYDPELAEALRSLGYIE